MFESVSAFVGVVVSLFPFTGATWFVLFSIGFFIWLFWKAHRENNPLIRWEDLFIDNHEQRVSPYRMGYMLGLVVSTWLIIKMSDRDALNFDIFVAYLSYLLGGAGWTEFVNRRGRGNSSSGEGYNNPTTRERPSEEPLPVSDGRNNRY